MNSNLSAILSLHAELSLVLILLVALLADLFMGRHRQRWFHPVICVLMALQIGLNLTPDTRALFGGMYVNTPFTSIVKSILSAGTLLIFLQSGEWLGRKDTHYKQGEFYVLTLATLLGMFFMVSSGHFLIFYIGLEMASIPMACLVALDKYRHHSAEAGAKFILSTMFSSALLLYGLSFIYGTSGTLYFADLPAMLQGGALQQFALVLFLAGMGFKMSLVPFHLWTADVYQGAPTGVTAYLSVISKGAAAVALAIVLRFVFPLMKEDWTLAVALLSVASITVANLMAILQGDMKRFMAFSSISQAGYILLGVLAGTAQGMASLVFYVAVYVAANVAVFAVIGTVEQHAGGLDRPRRLPRTLPHEPSPDTGADVGPVLVGRHPPVCRFLLQVLYFRGGLCPRVVFGCVPRVGEHHRLPFLLPVGGQGHVHLRAPYGGRPSGGGSLAQPSGRAPHVGALHGGCLPVGRDEFRLRRTDALGTDVVGILFV